MGGSLGLTTPFSCILVFLSFIQKKSSPNGETENAHPHLRHLCPLSPKSGQPATSFCIRPPRTQVLSLGGVSSTQPGLVTHLLWAGHSVSTDLAGCCLLWGKASCLAMNASAAISVPSVYMQGTWLGCGGNLRINSMWALPSESLQSSGRCKIYAC